MKSKREISQDTGIKESAFNYWLVKGLLPSPVGARKRVLLWPDYTVDIVNMIKSHQANGKSLTDASVGLAAMEMSTSIKKTVSLHIKSLEIDTVSSSDDDNE